MRGGAIAVTAMMMITGCSASDGGTAIGARRPMDPPAADAGTSAPRGQALFEELYPALNDACGACHSGGAGVGPVWLEKGDPYASIKSYAGIVVVDPSTSKLLARGAHSGPELVPALFAQSYAWLEAEAEGLTAATQGTRAETAALVIAEGDDRIDLSDVGTAPRGTALTFRATHGEGGAWLELASIAVVAPADHGVRMVHPTFGVVTDDGIVEDPLDDFAGLDETVAAGASMTLGDGIVFLHGWSEGARVRVSFERVESSSP